MLEDKHKREEEVPVLSPSDRAKAFESIGEEEWKRFADFEVVAIAVSPPHILVGKNDYGDLLDAAAEFNTPFFPARNKAYVEPKGKRSGEAVA